ncbi:MAG: hypothetical protein ACRDI0_10430 [Actinomycetota bacterium]
MRSGNIRALAVLSAAMVLAGGVETATAHEFEDETSLTIKAVRGEELKNGVRFVFKGKLKAPHKFCRKKSEVLLIRIFKNKPNKVVGSDLTNWQGAYKFAKKVTNKRTYRTKFNGKAGGVHPHRHVCFKSTSKKVTVKP